MTSLTTNQSAALAVFHSSIESYSDFGDHDYFTMPEMIETLESNGWDVKSAEGTIGSLLASDQCRLYEEEVDDDYLIYVVWLPSDHPLYGCND
jgi:hypothetical protein|tara:strand:+ start:547 stop:825 length:279 start_codon:yes stop_codon:yes gene_type:complete